MAAKLTEEDHDRMQNPPMPDDFGIIKKKDKLSGIIKEEQLRETLDDLIQNEDLQKRVNAINYMSSRMQNRAMICDFISGPFIEGDFPRALMKARADLLADWQHMPHFRAAMHNIHNIMGFLEPDDPWPQPEFHGKR